MFENPTIADFKTYFFRDFPYGIDPETSILDLDIGNAFLKTNAFINPCLFKDQSTYNIGYNLLSAHYLVMAIRASSQGIAGQFTWNATSKAAGNVSESTQIPQRILDNPEFSWLSKTNYGAEYLALILPSLSGQMYTVHGSTRP